MTLIRLHAGPLSLLTLDPNRNPNLNPPDMPPQDYDICGNDHMMAWECLAAEEQRGGAGVTYHPNPSPIPSRNSVGGQA